MRPLMAKKTILVVDDAHDFTSIIARFLEREGYQTIQANDGVDGLRFATEEHPDLILLDALMPVMDGYELLLKLKLRKVPTRVVMVSALGGPEDIVRFTRAGAYAFLVKPIDLTVLLDVVRKVLEVESTIGFVVNDAPPIVEQLIATTEKLERDKQKLSDEIETLRRLATNKPFNQHLIMIAIRLLCLTIAVGITSLLFAMDVISKTQALLVSLLLFFLLLLPIERIRRVSLRIPKAETGIEMDDK
jgi:DNA-binding response OmpR family regulator